MELSKKNLDSIQDMAKALEAENFKLQLKDKEISLSKEKIEAEQQHMERMERATPATSTGNINKKKKKK